MATESPRFFFSYVREDSVFVLKLARELRNAGANLWMDRLDIRGGQRWDEAVQAALQSCQGMLTVLSPCAVASQNVMDEVSYALEERKQLIPVLYQECAIPFRLRRVQYVDFSSGYDEGFAELLRALDLEQPTEKAAPPKIEGRGPEAATQPVPPEEQRRDESVAAERTAELAQETPEMVRHEVQEAPREVAAGPAPEPAVSSVEPPPRPSRRRRKGALVGAISASIIAAATYLSFGIPEIAPSAALLAIIPGAIAGAITGANRRVIKITVVCFVGTAVVALASQGLVMFSYVLMIGLPFSAVIGAMAGMTLDLSKRRGR
ncbi:MAG TPA: TIR domain-containing protein [Thermoanaerobaculia bacterium]|nr:TIR domain-containing protein [Thermoanaerobaculia bacterium]